MRRSATCLSGLITVGVLVVAGCGSPGGAAGTTAPTGSSAAGSPSAPASSRSATTSAAVTSSAAVTTSAAATTAGTAGTTGAGPSSPASGPDGTLDASTVSWFASMCTGLTTVASVRPPTGGVSLNQVGTDMAAAGRSMAQTAQEMQAAPDPTFDGSADFGPAAESALASVGGRLTELGQRAEALQPGDTGAGQQFIDDYQLFVQDLQQTLGPTLNLRREVVEAVVAQVPDCRILSGALTSGG